MFKNYIQKIKDKKNLKTQIKRGERQKWIDKLNDLGFKEIEFPIFIVYDKWNGINLTLVGDLEEFAVTNSIHYWQLDNDSRLLDRNGRLWSWKYDHQNKTNLPNTFIKQLTLKDVKKIVIEGIIGFKSEDELKTIIVKVETIEKLFNRLNGIFP